MPFVAVFDENRHETEFFAPAPSLSPVEEGERQEGARDRLRDDAMNP